MWKFRKLIDVNLRVNILGIEKLTIEEYNFCFFFRWFNKQKFIFSYILVDFEITLSQGYLKTTNNQRKKNKKVFKENRWFKGYSSRPDQLMWYFFFKNKIKIKRWGNRRTHSWKYTNPLFVTSHCRQSAEWHF